MKLELGIPTPTKEEKARAWNWLRNVAEWKDEAAVACIEWTRLANKEKLEPKFAEARRWIYVIIATAVLIYMLWPDK